MHWIDIAPTARLVCGKLVLVYEFLLEVIDLETREVVFSSSVGMAPPFYTYSCSAFLDRWLFLDTFEQLLVLDCFKLTLTTVNCRGCKNTFSFCGWRIAFCCNTSHTYRIVVVHAKLNLDNSLELNIVFDIANVIGCHSRLVLRDDGNVVFMSGSRNNGVYKIVLRTGVWTQPVQLSGFLLNATRNPTLATLDCLGDVTLLVSVPDFDIVGNYTHSTVLTDGRRFLRVPHVYLTFPLDQEVCDPLQVVDIASGTVGCRQVSTVDQNDLVLARTSDTKVTVSCGVNFSPSCQVDCELHQIMCFEYGVSFWLTHNDEIVIVRFDE